MGVVFKIIISLFRNVTLNRQLKLSKNTNRKWPKLFERVMEEKQKLLKHASLYQETLLKWPVSASMY